MIQGPHFSPCSTASKSTKNGIISDFVTASDDENNNWASEASPTLGCSIEISRDILCACVCHGPKSVGGNTWAKHVHAQSQYWAVKSDQ